MVKFVPGGHILFVCPAGITRSPMAAAVFDAEMKARKFDCRVGYACLMPFMTGVRPSNQWGMIDGGRNYDLSSYRARDIGLPDVYTDATFLVGMTADIARQVQGITRADDGRVFILNPPSGVLDPGASITLDAYETSFAQIRAGTDTLIETLGINQPR